MKAIIATDPAAGNAGMRLEERPAPDAEALAGDSSANFGDVVVEVHASGFTANELEWASTWVDRAGRDRTPTIPGHEVAGVVSSLAYGTTGLTVGQRVFGLTDWTRDGSLAEYALVEARNLAPLPATVDFVTGANVVMSGLTAWQALFDHGGLRSGQSVLVHGAAGAVGSMAVQLARQAGAHVIGTGRTANRETALDFGAHEFLDLSTGDVADAGRLDLVFDVFGGDIGLRSLDVVRPGGSFVTVAGMPQAQRTGVHPMGFIVVPDRAQLTEIGARVADGRLRPHIGRVASLDDAVEALSGPKSGSGKTMIRVR